MKLILTITLLFLSATAFASSPSAIVSGSVKDARTGQPLEFAQAALMKQDSTLLTGAISDVNGNFQLATTEEGNFLLRISFVGYDNIWKPVNLNQSQINLGEISMTSLAKDLKGVEISAGAILARTDGEKRIFNVENMSVSEGGTALQVLETLPSVQVDQEGNLSLRGSGNVLILIDGKPANLSGEDAGIILQQYPANLIKEVELITNPSARYDAEGVGGIINIVLKQKRTPGVNGQVNLSAATGNKYTGGLILNYRKNKLNLSASYSLQSRESWRSSTGLRNIYFSDFVRTLDQNDRSENSQLAHTIRTGLDYEFSKAASARLFANYNIRESSGTGISTSRHLSGIANIDSTLIRNTADSDKRSDIEVGSSFNWQGDKGRKLMAQATVSFDDRRDISTISQFFYPGSITENPNRSVNQIYERPAISNRGLLQLDYEQQISEAKRLEIGLKSNFRSDEREQFFSVFDAESNNYLDNPDISNSFTYNEQIHAAYAIFRNKIGQFSYQAGLRSELTLTESYQPKIDSTYNFESLNLFPSVFLAYDLGNKQNVQISYSRRIRRPWGGSLVPFIYVQDEYNQRSGNPYLKPEFTDNFELNYNKSWQVYTLNAGIFHRYTTNALSRMVVQSGDVTLVSWQNANTRNSTGLELVNNFMFSRNLNARLTGNLFRSSVSAETSGTTFSNERISWTLNLMGNYNIPKLFSTQIIAFYQGPIVVPQGEIMPTFSMNIGLRRNLMNNQATISVNASDVFNTRRFALKTETDVFLLDRQFNFDSRVFTIAFTYRFLGYRERNGSNREGGFNGGEMEDMF
jgi:iron complex outermembrane recepter protein